MGDMACAVCGETFDDDELLFSDQGRICESCELDVHEQKTLSRGIWMTIIGGPITVVAGTVMVCVPIAGPFLMLVFGAIALWRGTMAMQVGWGARQDEAVGSLETTLLWVSGAVTGLWSIGLVITGGVLSVLALYHIFTNSPVL